MENNYHNRHELMAKLEEIQDANYKNFKGTNEADLHTREEIADLFKAITEKNQTYKQGLHDIRIMLLDRFGLFGGGKICNDIFDHINFVLEQSPEEFMKKYSQTKPSPVGFVTWLHNEGWKPTPNAEVWAHETKGQKNVLELHVEFKFK